MMPWAVDKLEKKTKKSPDASKWDPKKHPRPEIGPEKATRDVKEEAQDPHGAQEANQARKVSNSLNEVDDFRKKKHQIP